MNVNDRTIAARFIPACAGNAGPDARCSRASAVHPRVRGERGVPADRSTIFAGSSPRARGTPAPGIDPRRGQRFIPACAGNAQPFHQPSPPASVHPRVRGERGIGEDRPAYRVGSSPRARGTPELKRCHPPVRRFIPACAGNTCPWMCMLPAWPVHPRVRGERGSFVIANRDGPGSSPRARGTRNNPDSAVEAWRFIPACAGNANHTAGRADSIAVHPRVRGERAALTTGETFSSGSSPRARGTPFTTEWNHQKSRFIPACAGNAGASSPGQSNEPVHPRVRGERSGG